MNNSEKNRKKIFYNISLSMNDFIKNLDDKNIDDLLALLYLERNTRLEEKIKNGDFPALTDEERRYAIINKIQAMKLYSKRTKLGLDVAMRMIGCFIEKL